MKQTRLASLLEQLGNTATGFVIALVIQRVLLPVVYGVETSFGQDLFMVAVFTVASILRGYAWRRLMEALQVRRPLSPFMSALVGERFRQGDEEGWTPEHDDTAHESGDLAWAGIAYVQAAIADPLAITYPTGRPPRNWHWAPGWWKRDGQRRDLVKGCALIAAEGDRNDRNRRVPVGTEAAA